MKNSIVNIRIKPKTYLFLCMLVFAVSTITACNGNNNHGDATASHDTSSAVSNRVDTEATGSSTKQP
ncbi:MAG: hypothetical protein EOP42_24470 [Sphingobacteriaceae bacterium]|nr:MAG: hypothetical protein EOP42_24470 [Sphingobacteriaceae bacterium]